MKEPKRIHIDATGMTDEERTIAMLTAILENITVQKKKRKAKDIREANRAYEKRRKKHR